MKCPRCGSTNCWDDNLWWGCNDCPWMGTVSYDVAVRLLAAEGGSRG